ncbi:MAG: pyridoxamine 5'-phosphate oxidase [Rhodospirillales bacterium]|nr:pyridoxamine 5'-phosphate oxidase [Rhodospirillales bacterium]MBO6786327.1 pyridoxamine 5'-phosphate oxidase [Rhodospirillales bacterium]
MADLNEPFDLFNSWFEMAKEKELNDPSAMNLATATPDGRPSSRMVLLKDFDTTGFVFYTNLESNKGKQLSANAQVALNFHWKSLRKQVRIEGAATPVSDEEADAYFQSRPRGSRIGAWASDQSRPMEGMFVLERRVAEFTAKFHVGEVPRPLHWSGFRVDPQLIEFWSDGKFRLHERIVYHRDGDAWTTERLFP